MALAESPRRNIITIVRETLSPETNEQRKARISRDVKYAQHVANITPLHFPFRERYGEFAGHALYVVRMGERLKKSGNEKELISNLSTTMWEAMRNGNFASFEAGSRLYYDILDHAVLPLGRTPLLDHIQAQKKRDLNSMAANASRTMAEEVSSERQLTFKLKGS